MTWELGVQHGFHWAQVQMPPGLAASGGSMAGSVPGLFQPLEVPQSAAPSPATWPAPVSSRLSSYPPPCLRLIRTLVTARRAHPDHPGGPQLGAVHSSPSTKSLLCVRSRAHRPRGPGCCVSWGSAERQPRMSVCLSCIIYYQSVNVSMCLCVIYHLSVICHQSSSLCIYLPTYLFYKELGHMMMEAGTS